MADRTIKPDSGNDLVLQNNGGGTKIEIPNSGDISLTGTIVGGTFNGTIGGSAVFPAGGTGNPISIAIIADQKASGSHGGTYVLSDGWKTRELNTEISDPDSIVTIASNQFTLGSGTYFLHWRVQMYRVEEHVSKLYDITGANDLAFGMSARGIDVDEVSTFSEGSFIHTISSNNTYEIRQKANGPETNTAMGFASGIAVNNYAIVNILKLK